MLSAHTAVNLDLLARLPLTAQRVLEIGCGAGALGRAYKARNPSAFYIGTELVEEAAAQARIHLDYVVVGDIEQDSTLCALDEALAGEQIDVLIFGGVLERLREPWRVLAALRERIAPGGICVACIPNVAHWSLVAGQLKGRWDYADAGLLDRAHLRFFTVESALSMFKQAGWSGADADARVLWPDKTQAALKALAPAAAALGADAEVMRRNLSAFEWVIRAINGPRQPLLQLSAMTVPKLGGVTEARVEEPLAALNSRPSITARWAVENLAMPKGAPGVLIFQRQLFNGAEFVEGVEQAVARGWVLVSDIDDDPRQRRFRLNDFLAFRMVHAVTVSTEPLAEIVRQWNPNVAVFPNAVSSLVRSSPSTPKQGERLRIFFGALNRDQDWAPLVGALNAAIRDLADRVEVVVVHDRAFHDALPEGVTREFHGTLPYSQYKEVLATCDIALLPLADTVFNRGKSDIKLIECCAAGVAPICSSVVYADDPRHAEIAVFADDAQAFADALTALCGDTARIAELRAKGLAYVSAHRMQAQQVAAREAFYRGLVANRDVLEAERRDRVAQAMTGALNTAR